MIPIPYALTMHKDATLQSKDPGMAAPAPVAASHGLTTAGWGGKVNLVSAPSWSDQGTSDKARSAFPWGMP